MAAFVLIDRPRSTRGKRTFSSLLSTLEPIVELAEPEVEGEEGEDLQTEGPTVLQDICNASTLGKPLHIEFRRAIRSASNLLLFILRLFYTCVAEPWNVPSGSKHTSQCLYATYAQLD
jgi:hypothetical protein